MEYVIKLNQQELQVIFNALGEIPLKLGIGVVEKIGQAVKDQDDLAARSAGVSLSEDVG